MVFICPVSAAGSRLDKLGTLTGPPLQNETFGSSEVGFLYRICKGGYFQLSSGREGSGGLDVFGLPSASPAEARPSADIQSKYLFLPF